MLFELCTKYVLFILLLLFKYFTINIAINSILQIIVLSLKYNFEININLSVTESDDEMTSNGVFET